jgi:hypothetical protein
MRTIRLEASPMLLLLAPCVLLAGCPSSPEPTPDAGLDAPLDAPTSGDDAFVAPDAHVPETVACRPCRRNDDCGEGNVCLPLGTRELACGLACETDDDCASLPVPSSCVEVFAGMPRQCQPTGGTCRTVEPGASCADDAACGGTFDRCVDTDGLGAYCTTSCRSDADCPLGLRRCADVEGEGTVCVRDRSDATMRCEALLAAGGATACGADGSCPSGTRCHGEAPLALCLGAPPCDAGAVEQIGRAHV